jgi:protein-S-isoprenylcysteine O-methyltransferase Ste14
MLLVLALGPLSAGSGPWVGGAWPGWVFCGLGAGVGVAGAWVLGRNRTIFPRPHSDSRLVQHGIYRAVRHPLYVSVMSLSLGWAWLWQSLPALLVAGLLGVLLDRKARREEVWLAGQFPGYGDYARRVRRFVPWLY